MFRTILVPLDGSPLAERAVAYATAVASADSARIVLLQATEAHTPPGAQEGDQPPDAARAAQKYLSSIAEQATKRGVLEVSTSVVEGDAAEAIITTARTWEAGLIAMSTHGRSGLGRWLYGSVADQVLRHAEVPVMLVSPACERAWPPVRGETPMRILLPLDGSELSQAAIPVASDLAATLGAGIVLLQVMEQPGYAYAQDYEWTERDPAADLVAARQYLEDIAAILRGRGHAVSVTVDVGPAAAIVAAVAREQGVHAIVMATHGRGGVARVVLGSVATGVLHRSIVPLILVRPALERAGNAPRDISLSDVPGRQPPAAAAAPAAHAILPK